jgi:radical SAM protein with 4Fe4S-binding SPASM domain
MVSGRIILSDNYTLKGSISEKLLIELRGGKKYALDSDQYEFLSLLDGRYEVAEIMAQYDAESQALARDFLHNLQQIGAISPVQKNERRTLFVENIPDPRLQGVHLEITSRCNMRCVHCYQGKNLHASDDLTLGEIKGLVDEIKPLQTEHIGISGGEPLLREDLFEIIRFIEKADMRVSSLFTNALLVNADIISAILACRSKFTIFTSLDAITPAGMKFRGFERREGSIVLKRVISNIKKLVASGIPVVINTVVARHNAKDLLRMYKVIRYLGIKSWRIGFPKRAGFFKNNFHEFEEDWGRVLNLCFTLLKHHLNEGQPFHLQIEYLFREELFKNFRLLSENDFVCDYEERKESCCIKPNGDVVSCAYCNDFVIGNIRQSRLSDIWYSQDMQTIKNMRIGDVAGCRDCNLRAYCATGCRINAFFTHGDFCHATDDHACKAVKFFVEHIMPFLKERGILQNI